MNKKAVLGLIPISIFFSLLFFAAKPTLAAPVCGNGIKEAGEQCDDGNTLSDDGCSSTCTLEGHIVIKKVTNPSTDTTTEFSFYGNAGGVLKNGQQIDWGFVTPGTYLQGESDPSASNYFLQSITCNDATLPNHSVIDLPNREVTLKVVGGQHLECTFTNKLLAPVDPKMSLTACKVKDADGKLSTTGDRTPVNHWLITIWQDGVEKDTQYTGTDGCFTWVSLPTDGSYPLTPGHTYGVAEDENMPSGWVVLAERFHNYGNMNANTSLSYTFINALSSVVPEFGLLTGAFASLVTGGLFLLKRSK